MKGACLTAGGNDMDYLNMTQQEKAQLRQEWLSHLTTSELLSNRSVSEVISNYSSSEVLSNYSTDQILAGLSSEQLKALSEMINSTNKLQ